MTTTDKDTEIQLLKAEIAKRARAELLVGDILHQNVLAMRAAVVAYRLEGPEQGLCWIINTLAGPGHLPDLDEAQAMGGAQAMFNAEVKEARAFRAAHPAPANPQIVLTKAAMDVLTERRRQIEEKGWTPEHDDAHVNDEIAALACFYAMPPGAREWDRHYGETMGEAMLPSGWVAATGDRRRELVKAAALALAEIERMDRAAAREAGRG